MANKKYCTGPRYEKERYYLSGIDGWHGCFGHLNVLKLDHESHVTGFGKHDRVVVFMPDTDGLYCRVDHVWELGKPSLSDIKKIIKSDNGFLPKNIDWENPTINAGDGTTDVQFHYKKKGL